MNNMQGATGFAGQIERNLDSLQFCCDWPRFQVITHAGLVGGNFLFGKCGGQ